MKLSNICTNCQTIEDKGITTIFSYGTAVLRVVPSSDFTNVERLWSGHSQTTMRHINKALAQLGETAINKAYWDKMPIMEG